MATTGRALRSEMLSQLRQRIQSGPTEESTGGDDALMKPYSLPLSSMNETAMVTGARSSSAEGKIEAMARSRVPVGSLHDKPTGNGKWGKGMERPTFAASATKSLAGALATGSSDNNASSNGRLCLPYRPAKSNSGDDYMAYSADPSAAATGITLDAGAVGGRAHSISRLPSQKRRATIHGCSSSQCSANFDNGHLLCFKFETDVAASDEITLFGVQQQASPMATKAAPQVPSTPAPSRTTGFGHIPATPGAPKKAKKTRAYNGRVHPIPFNLEGRESEVEGCVALAS